MELPEKPRRIWLRSFYGFDPEGEGYIGWTDESHRDRMLSLIEDGDLFMIYGTTSSETKRELRHRVMGFLQVEARAIRDVDRSSAEAMKDKIGKGWKDKWVYAIPVVRAWRADEAILLERIASETYRPEAGRSIANWSAPLLPKEIDLALKIRVTEVNVFGEPPISSAHAQKTPLGVAYRPSRAFPASFGERRASYEDGPTTLYLARFNGDGHALMGQPKPMFDKSVLLKIGVSNDIDRRVLELNAGFPPASLGKWSMDLVSQPFEGSEAAEKAEQIFKDKAAKQMESLGGEFFRGDWTLAQMIFATIRGVSRFGG